MSWIYYRSLQSPWGAFSDCFRRAARPELLSENSNKKKDSELNLPTEGSFFCVGFLWSPIAIDLNESQRKKKSHPRVPEEAVSDRHVAVLGSAAPSLYEAIFRSGPDSFFGYERPPIAVVASRYPCFSGHDTCGAFVRPRQQSIAHVPGSARRTARPSAENLVDPSKSPEFEREGVEFTAWKEQR